ncbi:CHAT domain-containing protein [Streptomyces sp. WAC05374]|uniref:AAA family ATPase n=1 Tax=Streptomyces sp. WAC05374 TaxID=2487420 RepID=UPI000F85EDB1|nr:AAA family ATPase [Streptomyces sp. WAC05374]TDF46436.1 CHAT domain-containing protein [Streptomyces sp. WAC05374]TDF47537.1 CHAT domain-containing protein [Streptomyces sp. WAC05374]
MDPLVLAATSASVVGALATDAWQHVRDRLVELFRHARPDEAENVSLELEEARDLILAAQDHDDARVEHELTVTLQRRLQDLVSETSSADEDLVRLLNELLISSRGTLLSRTAGLSLLTTLAGGVSGVPVIPLPGLVGAAASAALTADDTSGASAACLPGPTVFDRLGPARMLPRDVPTFTGREDEVAQLVEVVDTPGEPSVCLVHGMPGAGKTALAVHTAHRVADRFPDGQLFINLRGHDPGDEPASPFQLLGTLLTAAGFPKAVQPESVHGRAGMWRSWLASRRMMIILDDAADFSQVEPLLPGYPGCLTVVTSRIRLEAAEVTRSVPVNELPPDASAQLFDRLLRHRGLGSDTGDAQEVARLCGNLPLALVFAAGVLLAHPTWQVPHLVDDLSSSPRRLTRLGGGRASVSDVLDTSVRTLDDTQRRFLRRLGMHPGPELEKRAAAVLADTTVEYADQCLDSLYRHSLLTEVSPGRFRMHVLLSSYLLAAPPERFAETGAPDGGAGPEEVRRRLVDYYRRTATAAYLLQSRQQSADALRGSLPELAPSLSGPSQAAQWLAAELDNLAACTQYTADHPEVVADLVTVVIAYLLQRTDGGIGTARQLVDAGHHRMSGRGDVRAQALFAHLSGLLAIAEGDLARAVGDLEGAVRTSLGDNWTLGAARAVYGLYLALRLSGRPEEAVSALDEAAELFAEADDAGGLRKAREQGAAREIGAGEAPVRARGPHPPPAAALVSTPASDDFLTQLENLSLRVHAARSAGDGGDGGDRGGDEPGAWADSDPDETPVGEPGPDVPHGGRDGGGGGEGDPPAAPSSAGFPDDEGRGRDADDVLPVHELDAVDAQHINFWFTDVPAEDTRLRVAESHTGCFQVGPDHPGNLAAGERVIPADEIPAAGLHTHWIVSSSTCELALPADADPRFRSSVTVGGDAPQWNVDFDLLIPPGGHSEERFVVVTPRWAGRARIDVMVMVDGDPYRELTVEFDVDQAPATGSEPGGLDAGSPGRAPAGGPPRAPAASAVPGPRPPATAEPAGGDAPEDGERRPEAVTVPRALCPPRPRQRHRAPVQVRARQRVPARETALHVPQDWQRAPRELSLYVNPPSAWWSMRVAGAREKTNLTAWQPSAAAAQRVRDAQVALDTYWQSCAQRYNLISAADVAGRLRDFRPRADWSAQARPAVREEDQKAWDADALGDEMRTLALAGSRLFRAMFPDGTELSTLVKDLEPGDRLTIHWKDCTPQHVPWPLLYRGRLPRAGQPVRAEDFLGLRLRISHVIHPCESTRSLDDDAVRAHLMYWGGRPDDETLLAAQEHTRELAAWQPTVLPASKENPKAELSAFLWDPSPVSLIYVFCQADTGAGNRPSLRFGSTSDACDVLQLTDMGDDPLTDKPLIFINACETSAAEHTYSNELQNSFLERGSRAYIGSECKVPTNFAARFAGVFFHFLYTRDAAGAPTAAGEALAQTRKFFWDEFRSIGGLFYSYINDDRVFIAKPHEVAAMHRPGPGPRTPQTRARQA